MALSLSLGDQPMANRFLKQSELWEEEPRYPLELFFCRYCSLVQLGATVLPELMFSNYAYASSTSASFRQHFEQLADKVISMLGPKSYVVEIGSNDGILLKPLKERGVIAIGVEPATNLASIATQQGVMTLNEFFSEETVASLGEGSADAVVGCNVFAHIPEIAQCLKNISRLLKPKGFLTMEVQDFRATIKDLTFDNCYLEHCFYWTLMSLQRFLASVGLRVFDASWIETHGGSLRVFADKGVRDVQASVGNILRLEEASNMGKVSTYKAFARRVRDIADSLIALLNDLRDAGKTIAGYGAPAKATTLLNYCGIGPKTIAYIVDDSPLKQGLYTPGTHIPIFSPEELEIRRPDLILVLAWNFFEPIKEKTKHLGVPYILPVPPRVVM